MATQAAFLLAHTPRRRYAIRQNDIAALHAVDAVGRADEQSLVKVDLGAIFDPRDKSDQPRRHGLFVPLRRKQIVFTADRVDLLEQPLEAAALPALLGQRLVEPWAAGALQIDGDLVILLDLRAVARSVLLAPPATYTW